MNPILNRPSSSVLQQFSGNPTATGDTPEASSGQLMGAGDLGQQFGAYGNAIFQGFITSEEYNNDLRGWDGIRLYDEMRRSDATVQASLKLLILPLMGADWAIQPASDSDEDTFIAKYVEYNLFELVKFRYLLSEILLCLPFGHSVFEKIYKYVDYPGDEEGKGAGRYTGIDRISSRKQDTIFAWQLANGQPGVQQITANGGVFSIPAEKLLIFTHQREGNNFSGISVLRPAYKHWYVKSQLEKVMAIAAERQGVGVPFFEAPTGATNEQLTKARNVMKNIRANAMGYMEMPVGWEYGFSDMHATGNYDPMPLVQYHNRQILLNVLGQFLDNGSSGAAGSRSTSEDHSKILAQSLESIATTVIEDVINENLIKQLVDTNFSTKKYPKLTHSPINDDNATTIPDAVQKLTGAGMLTADAELETWLRKMFKMPDLPQETRDLYDKKREQTTKLLDAGVVPGFTKPGDPNNPGGQQPDKPGGATPTGGNKPNEDNPKDDIKATERLARTIAEAREARLQLIKAAEEHYAGNR
jgi:hypothetical protein